MENVLYNLYETTDLYVYAGIPATKKKGAAMNRENIYALAYVNDHDDETMRHEFARMCEYIECLKEVDTEGISPLIQPVDYETNVFRRDEIIGEDITESFLKNAPNHTDNMITVPDTRGREQLDK